MERQLPGRGALGLNGVFWKQRRNGSFRTRFGEARYPHPVAPCLTRGLAFLRHWHLRWTDTARGGWVYITANRYRGGMYVGVSADVIRRVHQHREGTGSAHVRDFGKTRLVYVEHHEEIGSAIAREKLAKKWRREGKFALIEEDSPDWLDLWDQWFGAVDEQG